MNSMEQEKGTQVLLVDEHDRPQGEMNKWDAHRAGALHRAFSVFLFDPEGKLLLQKRATGKYHSGGLWTNTCCSHPKPEEDIEEAASRRLQEEMGIETSLRKLFTTRYYLELGDGMVEHELDHVFLGISSQEPVMDDAEVMDRHFAPREEIEEGLRTKPEVYTEWFKVIWQDLIEHERTIGEAV